MVSANGSTLPPALPNSLLPPRQDRLTPSAPMRCLTRWSPEGEPQKPFTTENTEKTEKEKADEVNREDRWRSELVYLFSITFCLCLFSVFSVFSVVKMFLWSSADGVHGAQRLDEPRRVDFVSFPFFAHVLPDHLRQSRVVRRLAQQRPNIHLVEREQTITQFAVRGQPQTIAAHAERPRYRSDNTNLAAAV